MSKKVIFGIAAIIMVLVANAIIIPLLGNIGGTMKTIVTIGLPVLDVASVVVIIVYVFTGR
jgi:hypothetical protein